jgi:hypothetical protein
VNNGVATPAIARRPLGVAQKEVKGLDLITRGVVAARWPFRSAGRSAMF